MQATSLLNTWLLVVVSVVGLPVVGATKNTPFSGALQIYSKID